MLTSLILTVSPREPTNLPRDLGRAGYALFLSLVSAQDLALAESLHTAQDRKPFTCSNVFGGTRDGASLLAQPGDALAMRYTGLNAAVSSALAAMAAGFAATPMAEPHPNPLTEGDGLVVELDRAPMRIVSATLDGATDARAGATSYDALGSPYLLSRERPTSAVTLRFFSPTAFRSRDQNLPLPLPGSVFGSLVDKWNAFAPLALPDEVRRFADECLAISQFRGHTRMLRGKDGGKQIGFVGEVTYRALNTDRYWLSLINVLADYAFFAGVGYGTTQGMGQCRRVTEVEIEQRRVRRANEMDD